MEALIRIGKPAVEQLIFTLEHREKSTSDIAKLNKWLWKTEAVIRALGEIGDKRASKPLYKHLKTEGGDSAAYSLAKINGKSAVDPLIRRFKKHPSIYNHIEMTLAEIGDRRALRPLIETLDKEIIFKEYHSDEEEWVLKVRANAAKALEILKTKIKNDNEIHEIDEALKQYRNKYIICKAYKNCRCVIQEKDTGPCSWDPENWRRCDVVKQNIKYYGRW